MSFNYKKEYERMKIACGEENTPCFGLHCDECILGKPLKNGYGLCSLENADKLVEFVRQWAENNPLEIDWAKVPYDTLVEVSEDGENWYRQYFAIYIPDTEYKFFTGYNCESVKLADRLIRWEYCRLIDDETNK